MTEGRTMTLSRSICSMWALQIVVSYPFWLNQNSWGMDHTRSQLFDTMCHRRICTRPWCWRGHCESWFVNNLQLWQPPASHQGQKPMLFLKTTDYRQLHRPSNAMKSRVFGRATPNSGSRCTGNTHSPSEHGKIYCIIVMVCNQPQHRPGPSSTQR